MTQYEDISIQAHGTLMRSGKKWKVIAGAFTVANERGPGDAICKARESGVAVIWHPGDKKL